jgi:hypothetical protein
VNRRGFFFLITLACSACGGSGTGPSSTAPRVNSISPSSGTTLGGTSVTISGANFAAGASVSIGGAAATDVTVVSSSTLTAKTPQHAAAEADVVVTVAGRNGALARAFTFVAPPMVTNQPPSIGTISVRHPRPRAPGQYASVGDHVSVSTTVSDAETSVDQLTFEWSSDVGGAFSGGGTSVTWTAPADLTGTPRTATLTLTVTERYNTTDGSGLPTTAQHRVTGTSAVRVHNSPKEVGDLAVQFLLDFSRQIDPNLVMRNFTPTCPGTAEELDDVRNNQRNFVITSYTVGTPSTSADFARTCPFRARFGDACAEVPVEWHSTIRSNGRAIWTRGIDQVTAILENDQWKLCASDYEELAASPFMPRGVPFKR